MKGRFCHSSSMGFDLHISSTTRPDARAGSLSRAPADLQVIGSDSQKKSLFEIRGSRWKQSDVLFTH
jgi:hypothetical protein